MPRPPRAETASTEVVNFRLTVDERSRLDDLVIEQGHKDRSALLRAWLEQGGPAPRAKGTRAGSIKAKPETLAPNASPEKAARVSSAEPLNAALLEQVGEAVRQARDPRLGLVHVPRVVRELMSSLPIEQIHAALFALNKNGTIELRPESGSEFISPNDAALCPPGPRGTIFSFARWTRTSVSHGSANETPDQALVETKLHELASREPPGTLLSIKALRALCGLSKPRFDAAVLGLSTSQSVTLHHHDFPASLSNGERAKLVVDGNGTHYVGIAPRKR